MMIRRIILMCKQNRYNICIYIIIKSVFHVLLIDIILYTFPTEIVTVKEGLLPSD